MTRTATCQCGQLAVACEGDPVRISVCHCLDCQKRSGSSFAAQARFPVDKVTVNSAVPEERTRRLGLLGRICDLMNNVADFSAIEG